MAFQEAVDFVAGFEAEKAPDVRLVDVPQPVFFGCLSFEDPAREVASAAHASDNVIGDLQNHIHAHHPTGFTPRGQADSGT